MPLAHANGARSYYRLEGAPGRPLLVLAHSIGADHGLWEGVVAGLAPHLQLLRYDLRGHGASDAPPGPYSIDMLARDLTALVDTLGLAARFSIAGISLGGMAALQLAATQPQRVERLVIANGLPYLPPPPDGWDARMQAALQEGMAPIAERMASRQLSAPFRERAPHAAYALRKVCGAMASQGYAGACAVLRDADLRPALARIQSPTLVISGADDPMLKMPDMEAMVGAIRAVRHVTLPTGHLSALEAPQAFAAAVLRFLASL